MFETLIDLPGALFKEGKYLATNSILSRVIKVESMFVTGHGSGRPAADGCGARPLR